MESCIFCQIVAQQAKSWKVMENEHAYAFLDINPVNPYHTLVIPKNHHRDVFDTPKETLQEIMGLLKEVTVLYQEKLGLKNMQIVCSSGREAQQDVFHVHFHIVPRKLGDGQNIRWTPHPEMRIQFDEMIQKLQ